jgi:predicted membrane-bound dolichyl-phosphate-mannose-protein mannosyltransferase
MPLTETSVQRQASRSPALTGAFWLRLPAQRASLLLLLLLVGVATVMASATRYNSVTFDEITTMSGGARGYEMRRWDLMPDYPPVTQYLYGLPGYLSGLNYPDETGAGEAPPSRYPYAQALMFESGNDPEQIAFRARLVAVALALLLALLTFLFTRSHYGAGAGLLAASLVAFLPDVLAHGGVAYNDVPVAAAFLAALWAVDECVRKPSVWRGACAGLLISIALGVKHSALVLGPVAVLLILVHAAAMAERREWIQRLGLAVAAAVVVGFLAQVALYGGDFTLAYLRSSTMAAHGTVTGANAGLPAYLLGRMHDTTPWYFYPLAFLLKTSAALHVLMLLATLGVVRLWNSRRVTAGHVLVSGLRAPIVGLSVFGLVLLNAEVSIGFRYALPVLPLICICTAVGVASLWRHEGKLLRSVIVLLWLWMAGSVLSHYPYFLSYTSEYQPRRDDGLPALVDSSLDWGQGLLALRDFMKTDDVPRVYLSYFGSALPHGYGIDYIPLPSFFPLPPAPETLGAGEPSAAPSPRFVAVSATNLMGVYFRGDPFGALRGQEPYRVLARTIFIYRIAE